MIAYAVGATFALSGLLLFMLLIAWGDTRIMLRVMRRGIEKAFGHDSKIYPDHEHD